jgi:hypothetical protein
MFFLSVGETHVIQILMSEIIRILKLYEYPLKIEIR